MLYSVELRSQSLFLIGSAKIRCSLKLAKDFLVCRRQRGTKVIDVCIIDLTTVHMHWPNPVTLQVWRRYEGDTEEIGRRYAGSQRRVFRASGKRTCADKGMHDRKGVPGSWLDNGWIKDRWEYVYG
jgi:hypothetical protein